VPLEVVSNIEGVDFTPYLKTVLNSIRSNWYQAVPTEARTPTMKQGCLSVEFSILKNGEVSGMRLGLTSGDEQLDRAAWQGIVMSEPFAALPESFGGKFVTLRFHFYYNMPMLVAQQTKAGVGTVKASAGYLTKPVPARGLYTPLPEWGSRVLRTAAHGTVTLSLTETETGDTRHVKIIVGVNHDLDRAVVKAVRTWRFQPLIVDGHAVEAEMNVRITFDFDAR
jgi:TonB family protein